MFIFVTIFECRSTSQGPDSRPLLTQLSLRVPVRAVGFHHSDLKSRINRRDPFQPRQSVIASCSRVQERLIYVSGPRWTAAQRPVLTLLRTAGATAEVLAGPAVPVQLFANELHSCMSKRKRVE